jgi:hypothetical protein
MNNKGTWLKKLSAFAVILLLIILFNLNKSRVYESETDVLFLPKNETIARELDQTIGNFQQVLMSLAFNDRIADGSDALAPGVELPNYKRKEFWNSKISITRAAESGVVRIKNFDSDSTLARELNRDTIESLIAITGNYYNINTDLEIRIVDGPIVRGIASQNLFVTIGQSVLWSVGFYLVLFFLFPFIFIKKEKEKQGVFGRNFPPSPMAKKEPVSVVLPEEENYFATKNFFDQVQKTQTVEKVVLRKETSPLPNLSSFGKKSQTPANLPVSEEALPDIFRQKEPVPEVKKETVEPVKKNEAVAEEYVPHEATPEEVKARLNRLLGGGK